MAGTIIADTIQATSQQISLNVGNTTILTASSTGLTLIPTNNVTINVANNKKLHNQRRSTASKKNGSRRIRSKRRTVRSINLESHQKINQ